MTDKPINYFYNIINTTIDKDLPWYSVKNNIIYIKGNPNGFKYYLEAYNYDSVTGKQFFIILSIDKIHDACRKCYLDNYGRLKIKPIAHKDYLKSIYDKDSNIKFQPADICKDYSSYVI